MGRLNPLLSAGLRLGGSSQLSLSAVPQDAVFPAKAYAVQLQPLTVRSHPRHHGCAGESGCGMGKHMCRLSDAQAGHASRAAYQAPWPPLPGVCGEGLDGAGTADQSPRLGKV